MIFDNLILEFGILVFGFEIYVSCIENGKDSYFYSYGFVLNVRL